MTVARIDAEMSYREFVRWQVYLGRKAQRQEQEANKAKAKAR